MYFAIVFNLFIALYFNHFTVLENKTIGRICQVVFLYQHTLEGFRVESESRTAFQTLAVRIGINILEFLIRVIRRYIRRLGDR